MTSFQVGKLTATSQLFMQVQAPTQSSRFIASCSLPLLLWFLENIQSNLKMRCYSPANTQPYNTQCQHRLLPFIKCRHLKQKSDVFKTVGCYCGVKNEQWEVLYRPSRNLAQMVWEFFLFLKHGFISLQAVSISRGLQVDVITVIWLPINLIHYAAVLQR